MLLGQVALFKGAENRAFCAGANLKSLFRVRNDPNKAEYLNDFFRESLIMDYLIAKMKLHQIAIWNGIVIGAGIGLSLHAPIKIATENTAFSMPGN